MGRNQNKLSVQNLVQNVQLKTEILQLVHRIVSFFLQFASFALVCSPVRPLDKADFVLHKGCLEQTAMFLHYFSKTDLHAENAGL